MNIFHKILSVLAKLTANCISASAIKFTVDGVRYSVNDDNTTVTVAGYPSDSEPTGNLTIPESVTYGGISYPVTSIGGGAFFGCSGLTSVTIPNSVTSIGSSTFNGCSGLTSVTIGNSVTSIGDDTFYGCSGLTSVNIPNSVTSIGNGAFSFCSGLTSVTIPNSVTYIGNEAFYDCFRLTSIVWNAKNCSDFSYSYSPFTGLTDIKTFEFGSEVERIPAYLCDGLTGLTSVTIGNSVTSIGDSAFSGCSGLTSVVWNAKNCSDFESSSRPFANLTNIKTFEFGSEVERIPAHLCDVLTGLTRVTIPNSVTSIGEYAFYKCSDLTSVTIGNSVTSIGEGAFCDCSGLTSIKVESGNSVYDSRENCNAIIETATNILISGCKNTIIPNSVTSIGEGAFWGCSGLTSVTIPNSVNEIGDWVFWACSGLTSITIPNSVTSIGKYAFSRCRGLTSVTIGNSVTSIGHGAFGGTAWYNNQPDGLVYAGPVAYKYKGTMPSGTSIVLKEGTKGIAGLAFLGCTGLTSITIPNSVTSIGKYAFSYCTGLTRIDAYPNPEKVSIGADAFDGVPKDGTLHVLPKYLSAYQTASEWEDFTNIKGGLTEIGASTSMER